MNGHRGHPVRTHAAEDRRKRFGCATKLLRRTEVSSVLASQKNFVLATNSFVQVRLKTCFTNKVLFPWLLDLLVFLSKVVIWNV